ncbi:hypothetical protein NLX83_40630 [Allokutzneria sp. A3M-2-11 16]|uniref:hypothetical protein n=1 Tax=Allokutzneria sp. A3M-2-11 16 TaxID=2962043 RepID=UPI0020B7F436|nr:hypothetical protein [Allokutzneria sp. A3M-2-11 16]MCP3805589.1 hypothetical protein [Allokutzneria sp. A3M-2-11 16]
MVFQQGPDTQTGLMKMMFMAGFLVALFGLGALLSSGPSIGALIALPAGAGLVTASIRLRNAALGQQLYRAVRPADPTAVLALWGGLAGLIALGALFGWLFDTAGSVLIVAVWPILVAWYRRRRTALQVDSSGVNVGGVLVPWTDVAEIVVSDPRAGQQIHVGARLHSRAPVQVVAQHQGFDLAKLTAMVAKQGPQGVRVVVTGPR